MEAVHQRVRTERAELHERRAKLGEFIRTNPEFLKLSDGEQKLLKEQHDVMLNYENILDIRIGIFESREPRRPDSKE